MKKIYFTLVVSSMALPSSGIQNGLSELLPVGSPQTLLVQALTSNTVQRPTGFSYTVPAGDLRALFVIVKTENLGNFPDYPTNITYGGKTMTAAPVQIASYHPPSTPKFLNMRIFYLMEADIATRTGDAFNVTYNQPTQNNGSSYTFTIYTVDEVDQSWNITYCGTSLNNTGTNSNDSIYCGAPVSFNPGNFAVIHGVASATVNMQPMTSNPGLNALYNQASNGIFIADFFGTMTTSQTMTPYLVVNGANTPRFIMASLNVPLSQLPLPIQLSSFTAEHMNPVVTVKWTSESEKSLDHYIVEKSTDGIQYEPLAAIPSKADPGQSTTLRYSVSDLNPAMSNYYRLKVVDVAGDHFYSKTLNVSGTTQQQIVLFPNPTNGSFSITGVSADELNTSLKIFNVLGQQLPFTLSGSTSNGSRVHVDELISGVYFVEFITDNKRQIQKLYIQ